MASFLQVNNPINHLQSPSNSFANEETASICPLITPSPPTNDLINPLPESNETNYSIGDELATILQRVRADEKCTGDSASSSSSALAEPSCTQPLNHRSNIYETKEFNEETSGKVQPMQLTFKNPPENYFFMSWNWPAIRKICTWLYIAVLVAISAGVISMIVALPKACNPHVEWYQGSVFYEVFPASFSDSNNDMIGDFKGISQHSDYFVELGVQTVRLNSIFTSLHYPEDYKNATSLMKIAPVLGTIEDFQIMMKHLKSRNISLVLDLPLFPAVTSFLDETRNVSESNSIDEALLFWRNEGVAGFYLKGLENFLDDPNFIPALRRWRKIIGPSRIFIVSSTVVDSCPPKLLNSLLANVNLVDVRLEIEKGLEQVRFQIDHLQNGTLFTRPGLPWLHWSLGDESTPRLANLLSYDNATLGATLLQFMLPGTVSIFYGNEIGLKQTPDIEERNDLKHLHQLAMMAFKKNEARHILPWMPGDKSHLNFDQIAIIAELIKLREKSAAIYISSVYKEGVNKVNSEIKYAKKDLLVIQRWYPRRRSFVIASNLGSNKIEADLSTLLYSGEVAIGPRVDSNPGGISFKEIALWPGESVIIVLD